MPPILLSNALKANQDSKTINSIINTMKTEHKAKTKTKTGFILFYGLSGSDETDLNSSSGISTNRKKKQYIFKKLFGTSLTNKQAGEITAIYNDLS